MIPAILIIWIALAIAFAAGYVLRVILEDADPGDIDDCLVDYSDEYDDYKPAVEPTDSESRHPLNIPILVLALIPFMLLSACLPRIETVTVQECELAPLEAKPSLPAVEYTERGSLLCLDTENQMKALEREVRLKEYGNYCEAAYKAAQKRCEVKR